MSKTKTKNNTLFLPREKIWVNPKVVELVTEESLLKSIPLDDIKNKDVDILTPKGYLVDMTYRKLSKPSLQDPVKNTPWDYLKFKDSSLFRPAALAFIKARKNRAGTNVKASYTSAIPGTTLYKKFWKEELRRIRHGYEPIIDGEPCGIRISGEFYFYLNYCVMQKIEVEEDGTEVDIISFPDFLSMDYYFFKELEARENPEAYGLPKGYKSVGITVAKARRKGFSYKAAAGSVWITAFPKRKDARPKVLIASDTGSDAALCYKKAMIYIDWITEYTPFGRKNPGSTKTNGGWTHVRASSTADGGHFTFGLENTRTKERRGRLSEIATVSLAQRADKAAGEGVQRVYFEESGKVAELAKAWEFTRPTLKVGTRIRGIAIIFGTGGEMVKKDGGKGHSMAFSNLFNNPKGADLAQFKNIHEYEHTDKECGWFVADMWYDEGGWVQIGDKKYESVDRNGNATFWVAELSLNQQRYISKTEGGAKANYDLFLTQHCKTPREAFLIPEGSVFPTADLVERQTVVSLSRLGFEGLRMAGELVESAGRIEFKPDLHNRLTPLDTYILKDNVNREGCLLQYEPPVKINGSVPEGSYIISVDPIGQNTDGGSSLSSIVVMKTPKYAHVMGPSKIVATYRGRSAIKPQNYVQELLLKLSKYYNAKITFENDRDGGILAYFVRTKNLHRLMGKPELILSRFLPGSKTMLREYGHSMASERHKRIGEDLVLDWLNHRHPEKKVVNNKGEIEVLPSLRNLDMLEDRAILEELIAYNRTGNFDTVMALMGAIIQINEHFNPEFLEKDDNYAQNVTNELMDFFHGTTSSSRQARERYENRKAYDKDRPNEITW